MPIGYYYFRYYMHVSYAFAKVICKFAENSVYLLLSNYFSKCEISSSHVSETSADNYFTRQYIPEDKSELHTFRRLIFIAAVGRLCLCGTVPQTDPLPPPQMIHEWIWSEQWWNDTDRWKPKNSEKHQPQCHFVHHESQSDWHGREPGPSRWEAGDEPPELWLSWGSNWSLSGLIFVCYLMMVIMILMMFIIVSGWNWGDAWL
jgi:hypothetical protein